MKWLLPVLLAAAAPLAGQSNCNFSILPAAFVFNGSSGTPTPLSATVTIDNGNNVFCTWSPTATASWIHIATLNGNPLIFTTKSQFSFTVDNNTGTTLRQDQITVVVPGNQFTIPIIQFAATCLYTVSQASVQVPVSGSSGSIQVTSGCAWEATSNQTWLTGSLDKANTFSGATSIGNGAVDYTVAPNPCYQSRTATLAVQTGFAGAPTVTFTQAGSNSNLSLSQTSLTTGSTAASGRITINTGAGCAWNAVSDSSWLQVSGITGPGPGSFVYNILANPGPARTGNVTVGPATFTVTQQATPPPPVQLTAIVNGASYAPGAISPGEIVVLGGTNMGPAQGVPYQLSADGKSIPSSLAGVQVTFGSLPAPLLYVSAVQINAIVPYGVTPGAAVPVQVQYQSQTSALSTPVAAASPGIFSQDRSGLGPGAILNQDSSLNSTFSPATAGSVIQIFATGGGATTPAINDGFLAPTSGTLPQIPISQVSVTIGGVPSPQVTYAGDAPGLVAGLTQINAMVPAGVTGMAVPVVVQIGAAQSQSGLTITVR